MIQAVENQLQFFEKKWNKSDLVENLKILEFFFEWKFFSIKITVVGSGFCLKGSTFSTKFDDILQKTEVLLCVDDRAE